VGAFSAAKCRTGNLSRERMMVEGLRGMGKRINPKREENSGEK